MGPDREMTSTNLIPQAKEQPKNPKRGGGRILAQITLRIHLSTGIMYQVDTGRQQMCK